MGTGPELPSRKHPRLRDYDYSRNGVYFLTICTRNRAPILSEIVGRGLAPAEVRLLTAGRIAAEEMENLPKRFPRVRIEASVIMPNHIHLLLSLRAAGASPRPTDGKDFGIMDVMRVFKSLTTRRWNQWNGTQGRPLWQTSYHDHIIRDDNDFLNHWSYLNNNPARWAEDEYYVCTTKGTGTTWAFLKRSRRG